MKKIFYLILVSGFFLMSCSKSQKKTSSTDEIQLLYVQTAENLIVDTTVKTIRLVNVNQQTLYFSDRPERIAGHILMNVYLENWTNGKKNNFKEDPPNASLSVYQSGQSDNIVSVVEISNPVVEGKDLTYTYKVIEGTMPISGGSTSLFIDCVGVRGVGVGHRGPGI